MNLGRRFSAMLARRRWSVPAVAIAAALIAGSSLAGLHAGLTAAAGTTVVADGSDDAHSLSPVERYGFELVEGHVKGGGGAILTLRLLDRSTGNLVPDAIVFLSRIDMAPDGMADMDAPLDVVPDTLPGYYRFETDLLMAGDWALTVAAKVLGDDAIVQSRLRVTVMP